MHLSVYVPKIAHDADATGGAGCGSCIPVDDLDHDFIALIQDRVSHGKFLFACEGPVPVKSRRHLVAPTSVSTERIGKLAPVRGAGDEGLVNVRGKAIDGLEEKWSLVGAKATHER